MRRWGWFCWCSWSLGVLPWASSSLDEEEDELEELEESPGFFWPSRSSLDSLDEEELLLDEEEEEELLELEDELLELLELSSSSLTSCTSLWGAEGWS